MLKLILFLLVAFKSTTDAESQCTIQKELNLNSDCNVKCVDVTTFSKTLQKAYYDNDCGNITNIIFDNLNGDELKNGWLELRGTNNTIVYIEHLAILTSNVNIIQNDTFSDELFSNLKTLKIWSNHSGLIFESASLDHLKSLERLILDSPDRYIIPKFLFNKRLMKDSFGVYFTNNSIECSCNLKNLSSANDLAKEFRKTSLFPEGIFCNSPPEFKGLSLFEFMKENNTCGTTLVNKITADSTTGATGLIIPPVEKYHDCSHKVSFHSVESHLNIEIHRVDDSTVKVFVNKTDSHKRFTIVWYKGKHNDSSNHNLTVFCELHTKSPHKIHKLPTGSFYTFCASAIDSNIIHVNPNNCIEYYNRKYDGDGASLSKLALFGIIVSVFIIFIVIFVLYRMCSNGGYLWMLLNNRDRL